MKQNGSPKPKFTTDDLRTWFLVELPVHKAFAGAPDTQVSGISDTSQHHVTDHVTDHVRRLLHTLANGEMSTPAIMRDLKLTHRPTLRANYLHPALEAGLVEMTAPESPHSRLQKYRLTATGRQMLDRAADES